MAADYLSDVTPKERLLFTGQLGLLLAATVGGAALSSSDDWRPISLFGVLLGAALLSVCFKYEAKGFNANSSFLATALAMVLLGPTPAAVIAVVAILVDNWRRKKRLRLVFTNVSTMASFPLVGGALFELAGGAGLQESHGSVYVIAVLLTFMFSNLINFLLIAVDIAVMDKQPVLRSLKTVYLPTVPTELAVGLLTAAVAFVYQGHDLSALALLVVVAFIFQYLLGSALSATQRKEELEARTQQLASLQVGLLSTVLQTLSLRDKMTARHSAAVARYARAVAREMRLSSREQDIIHTAGLLHDIGKFIFPDSILMADTRLTAEQFEIVKKHPEQGARLVERIEGYGSVAEIILAHHERIDGGGYPFGLEGEEIPLASRIISVVDTYDAMTSRDSYRVPISSHEAVAELRRVSDQQLDGAIVEIFVSLLERGGLTFRHADDADFEHELNFEARVRDYASPQPVAA
jgi:putative nucleotidyltransferase with HDIG domain